MAQGDLGLVRDEEAAGARVLAVAEGEVVDAGADEVGLVAAVGGAHAVEAEAVEFLRRGVHAGVPHAVAGDADDGVGGEVNVF